MKQTTQTYLSLPETFHPASTASGKHPDSSMPRCYSDGRPYYSLNAWLKDQFGQKIYKLALDGGMTCPNRDGTLGTGGCIFCSHGGSGDFAEPAHTSVTEQIEAAKARVANKIKDGKYVAYFQSYTNTYAPVSYLEPLFSEAIAHPDVAALSIGTRPDCLPPETVALLSELAKEKYVSVELGLQTVHEKTARAMNRGYDTGVYFDAVQRLHAAGLETVTHLILGLPGETEQDMVESARQVAQAGTEGVKFHLLHVMADAPLAADYARGAFRCLELEKYGEILVECLRQFPESTVVHRITGDGARRGLVAPLWSLDKKRVLNYLNNLLSASGLL